MVVDIEGSEDPPHQNLADWRYYRRSGTESLPMEHDLVALLFGRRLGPILSVEFQTLGHLDSFNPRDPPMSNRPDCVSSSRTKDGEWLVTSQPFSRCRQLQMYESSAHGVTR